MIKSLITKGRLSLTAEQALRRALSGFEGKWVEIEVKEPKRSLAQNRYRFGIVVAVVRNALNDYLRKEGLPTASVEDVDIFIKDKALGLVHKVDTPIGEIIIAGRLKDKTKAEFEESMEAIRAHFAQKGIQIPHVNEHLEPPCY